MPVPYFPPYGAMGLENGLTMTVFAPADTNATTNLIVPGMPLLLPLVNTYTCRRPAADANPVLISNERQERPNQAIGVRVIGYGYADEVKYTGSIPAGTTLMVTSNGDGTWKLVASGGVGYVLSAAGGKAIVLFPS